MVNYDVEAEKATAVHRIITDAIAVHGFNRVEAITGALSVLAYQIANTPPSPIELAKFIEDASTWMSGYLNAKHQNN